MKVARVLAWCGVGFWAVVYPVVLGLCFLKAAEPGPGKAGTPGGWSQVISGFAAYAGPAEFSEASYENATSSSEASLGQLSAWLDDNAFMVSNAALMFPSLLGLGLMAVAVRHRWAMLAALGGLAGVVLTGFIAFGFDLAYPGDFAVGGIVPRYQGPSVLFSNLAAEQDPLAYGMGMSMWTDLLYQANYAVLAGLLVAGLAAGSLRLSTVLPAAAAVGLFGFPMVVSWFWGGGIFSSMEARDFAGAAPVHVLAGSAGLALVLVARLSPPEGPLRLVPGRAAPDRPAGRQLDALGQTLWIAGVAAFLLVGTGVSAGSVLSNDTPVVVAVLVATLGAIASGAAAAGGVSVFLARRSRLVIVTAGALAGWAAISGPSDVIELRGALWLGGLAGALAAAGLWAMDRWRLDDPLGLVPAHLLGGALGLLSCPLFDGDARMLVQLLFLVATAAAGLSLAGMVALAGWFAGVIWRSDAPEKRAEDSPHEGAALTGPG